MHKTQSRKDLQRRADNQQRICLVYGLARSGDPVPGHGLPEKNDIRLDPAATLRTGGYDKPVDIDGQQVCIAIRCHTLDGDTKIRVGRPQHGLIGIAITFDAAIKAADAAEYAVQINNVVTAGNPMQVINVLCNQPVDATGLFKGCQCTVRGIGPGGTDPLPAGEAPRPVATSYRTLVDKVTKLHRPRVLPAAIIGPIVRDAGRRAAAGTAQHGEFFVTFEEIKQLQVQWSSRAFRLRSVRMTQTAGKWFRTGMMYGRLEENLLWARGAGAGFPCAVLLAALVTGGGIGLA